VLKIVCVKNYEDVKNKTLALLYDNLELLKLQLILCVKAEGEFRDEQYILERQNESEDESDEESDESEEEQITYNFRSNNDNLTEVLNEKKTLLSRILPLRNKLKEIRNTSYMNDPNEAIARTYNIHFEFNPVKLFSAYLCNLFQVTSNLASILVNICSSVTLTIPASLFAWNHYNWTWELFYNNLSIFLIAPLTLVSMTSIFPLHLRTIINACCFSFTLLTLFRFIGSYNALVYVNFSCGLYIYILRETEQFRSKCIHVIEHRYKDAKDLPVTRYFYRYNMVSDNEWLEYYLDIGLWLWNILVTLILILQ
jgi:hypothetical protein